MAVPPAYGMFYPERPLLSASPLAICEYLLIQDWNVSYGLLDEELPGSRRGVVPPLRALLAEAMQGKCPAGLRPGEHVLGVAQSLADVY